MAREESGRVRGGSKKSGISRGILLVVESWYFFPALVDVIITYIRGRITVAGTAHKKVSFASSILRPKIYPET